LTQSWFLVGEREGKTGREKNEGEISSKGLDGKKASVGL
jgi:hypothetical protein